MLCRSISLLLLVAAVAFAHSSEESENDVKNGTHHHGHGLFRHYRGRHGFRHQPEFLKDLSKEAKKEYFDIVFNKNATKADIKKSVAAWAKKSGVEKQVTDEHAKRELFFAEHNKNITEAIPKLAEAQASILAVLKDHSLTHAQTWEKIKAQIKDYSPQLRALLWAMKPHHGHRGHHGHKGHREEEKKGEKKEEVKEEKEEDDEDSDEDEEEEKKE